MPTPRGRFREPSQIGPLAIVAAAATLLLIFVNSHSAGLRAERASAAPSTWLGLVGVGRPRVNVERWRVVVLKAPSLASHLLATGGTAREAAERRWTREAADSQKTLLSRLALEGVQVSPEFTFTRVINGFSAELDPQGIALLDRAPEVRGVYPVRVGYPAASSERAGANMLRAVQAAAHPPGMTLPGFDGRGVTVALLDTGVDRLHPYLTGRVLPGRDIVSGAGPASAQADPSAPADVERHGTEMAGVIVGRRGSPGLRGIAPGATLLPLRVAGWQRDESGGQALYGRSDQLIAGLEAAVDPNGDGDAHDAARIAAIGLAEPYVSFGDAPEARAVDGARALDTLVVTPAGNDLTAGPAFGSISGPGGAGGALTVAASDQRGTTEQVQVAIRSGLELELERTLPLAGASAPTRRLDLRFGAPRAASPAAASSIDDFFDRKGRSLVAGRAALVPAGTAPEIAVENAARAGADAIFVYGNGLPAGALGLEEKVTVPVIAFPTSSARRVRAQLASGQLVDVTVGKAATAAAAGGGGIAGFSSRGLAYDGSVKPSLAAPGVSVPTAEPGTNEDGTPRFGTVNGTSVAAAGVAGAAALLAQARPDLSAADLAGLLVGTADAFPNEPVDAQGAGLVDAGSAAAAEVSAIPPTLALPPLGSRRVRAVRRVVLHNVSTRPLRLTIGGDVGSEVFSFRTRPKHLRLRPGRTTALKVVVVSVRRPKKTVAGAITVTPESGRAIRIPWLAAPKPRVSNLLSGVRLTPAAFDPIEAYAQLTLSAGRITGPRTQRQIEPLSRLEIALRTKTGRRLGVLARLRDQLPGRYTFGITGRAPTGQLLPRGQYELIVRAYPTAPGPVSRKIVRFRIKR